jgi:hypothetical protein
VAIALKGDRIAVLMNFRPLAAVSTECINVLWSSRLGGTYVDPTGQTSGEPELTPQISLPVSSGNLNAPPEPSAWYPGSWLDDATLGTGNIAQYLVGPGSAVTFLAAGQIYDVWSKLTGGSSEVPAKFVGQLSVI